VDNPDELIRRHDAQVEALFQFLFAADPYRHHERDLEPYDLQLFKHMYQELLETEGEMRAADIPITRPDIATRMHWVMLMRMAK
jgi:hypothetical protein